MVWGGGIYEGSGDDFVSKVKVDVFNMLGKHITVLLNSKKAAGYHIVHFDANRFPTGLYFYTIRAGSFHKVKKMLLVK